MLRLLWSKTGYDEVARAECQPAIDGVFKCLASEDHTVSYPAALVVSYVVSLIRSPVIPRRLLGQYFFY